MANWVLFQWGPIQFQVFPLNVSQVSHATASDWAKKEIAGAAMYREWVGENDERIELKGRIFPHYFARKSRDTTSRLGDGSTGERIVPALQFQKSSGGLGNLEILDLMRREGQSHILIRGDGWHLGWFIVESLQRGHSLLAGDGIGQMIEFDAAFQRVPVPNDPALNFGLLWGSASTP